MKLFRVSSFEFRVSQQREAFGFTLLEMVVAIGIFTMIIVIAIAAVIGISEAELKSRNIQSIQDNLRFSLEAMTKELRTGINFTPSGGTPPAYSQVNFTASDGASVGYCLRDGAIRRLEGTSDCTSGSPITANEIVVSRLVFYVIGNSPGPGDGQPRLSVAIRARSADPKLLTALDLQTTITPRARDQ